MTIRTRFAPSPTGYLHVGGARTALYSWLVARKSGGKFILRIEDTDRERSTQESIDAILDGMKWLGLGWDEGPYYQSERMDRYREVIRKLLEEDKAYYCYCSKEELDEMREAAMASGDKPRYNGKYRDFTGELPAGIDPVVRFKNPPDGNVVFDDQVRGRISISNTELDDLIIARADGTPTYNFTVVVDDWDMGITHVVRGDDHVNNTPRQINILQALGAEPPVYAHVPMILGDDGKRLSKRHGAVSVMQYKEEGYLPEALLNYLVRLGWSHGDEEIFSLDQMIEKFDIKDVNRAAASFNTEKLQWLNQQYIKEADAGVLVALVKEHLLQQYPGLDDGPDLGAVVESLRERARTINEMADKAVMFYRDYDVLDEKAAKKNLRPVVGNALRAFRDRLEGLETWQTGPIHDLIESTAADFDLNMGKLGQPIRVAVTGSPVSPPIDETVYLMGRDRSLRGLDKALSYIEKRAANSA